MTEKAGVLPGPGKPLETVPRIGTVERTEREERPRFAPLSPPDPSLLAAPDGGSAPTGGEDLFLLLCKRRETVIGCPSTQGDEQERQKKKKRGIFGSPFLAALGLALKQEVK